MQPRIAMVLPYYHPQYGGAENQARLLARHLVDKHGLAVLVLTLHLFGGPRKETLDGHTVLRFGKPSASDSIAEGFQEILAWLESNTDSYDIVHQHFIFGQMPERQLDVARLCARIDKPCIMKVTSSEKITSLCRSVPDAKSALSLYRAIVAINSEIATELDVAGVSASRVAAIPNGVDTSFYRPPSPSERLASRKASDLKEQEFSALFVGRLVAKKDLGTFLRACSMLRESPRTLRAAVVGGDANDQAKRQPDNVPAQDSLRAYAKEL